MDLMLDLETTGTNPESTGILQIAAVPFNIHTKRFFADQKFDRCLSLPIGRNWSLQTKEWWSKQPEGILDGLVQRAEPPEIVIPEFYHYVKSFGDDVSIWAKPINFDLPFVESYLRQFNYPTPWKYWLTRDVNTYIAAKTGRPPKEHWDVLNFIGDKHDGFYDVLHQIKGVLTA